MRSERLLSGARPVPVISGGYDEGVKLRRTRRWTTGSIVPVVLAVLAAGFGYAALQDRSALTTVVVAAVAVPVGAPVNAGNTRFVKVHASDTALLHGVLSPVSLSGGWVAAVALESGQPVTLAEVVRPSRTPALGQMSVAVPSQQAAGGRISTGDLVDVIAASATGGSHYVAQALRVLAVAPTSTAGGVLGEASTGYYVIVAVDKLTALHLAAALGLQGEGASGGQLEIVRSTGERKTTPLGLALPAPVPSSGRLGGR
jgi:Flp pilus assembly protein CpaB